MTDQDTHLRRMARSSGLSLAGAGVSAVSGFLLVMAVTHGLSKDDAGTVFATTSLFLIAMAVVLLGTDVGVVRWIPTQLATGGHAKLGATLRAAYLPVTALSVVVAVATLAAAPALAGVIGDADHTSTLTEQLRVLAVALPFAAVYTLTLAATRGFRTMRPTVLVDSLGRDPVQLVLVVVAGVVGLGATGFVVAWALPYPVALLAIGLWLLLLLRRCVPPGAQQDAAAAAGVARRFWRYTSPRAIATIAQTLLKRSDIVLVAALRSPAEAALYAAATRFVVFGQLAVQALTQVLAPNISAMFARKEHDAALEIYRTTTAWAMTLAWPVYLVSAVLAPWVLRLFGSSYQEGASVVVVLSLAMLVATACGSVDTVLLMAGRSWLSLTNTGIALAVNLGLNLVLIPRIGILGAGISWAVAILVRNALPLYMINRMLGMNPFGAGSAWVAVSAVGSFGVVPVALRLLGAPLPAVLVSVAVGCVAYATALWVGRQRIRLTAFRAALRPRRARELDG